MASSLNPGLQKSKALDEQNQKSSDETGSRHSFFINKSQFCVGPIGLIFIKTNMKQETAVPECPYLQLSAFSLPISTVWDAYGSG